MPLRLHSGAFMILLLLSVSFAGSAKKVAVQDFSSVSNSLKAGEGELLGDALREGMGGLPEASFVLMTRENITELLPPGKTLEECTEGQCEVEIGRKLGADYLVIGKVLRVGKSLVATVKAHRIQPVGVLLTRQVKAKGIEDLQGAVTALGREVQGKLLAAEGLAAEGSDNGGALGQGQSPSMSNSAKPAVPDEVGTIVTLSAKGGAATFSLDGKPVCRDQETCQQELSNGKHVVMVSRAGYRDTAFSIAVPRGENRYSIGLNPKLGILTIRAQDDATGQALVAEIVVDGTVVGNTPKSISIPLATQRISLRAPAHADVAVSERPEREGDKVSVNAKMAATKAPAGVEQSRPVEAASRASYEPFRRSRSVPIGGKADCEALYKVQAQKNQQMELVNKLNEQGRAKKDECASLSGASQDRCYDDLKSLKSQIQALQAKIQPVQDDIDRHKAFCPESWNEAYKTLDLYEAVAKEACVSGPKGDSKRCEDALFNIAEINYQLDQRDNLAYHEKYEREWAAWKENDKRGIEPKPVVVSYAKGLAAHLSYLLNIHPISTANRRDVILYRTAFIYDLMGRSPDAFPLLMEISRYGPQSRQIGPTNLRIGEFYFVDKKFDSAIAYYNKVDPNSPGNESVLGLALYHKAEALYSKARYSTAVDAFFDYVERCDRGQIRGDLRAEGILYMGSCFAEFPDSYNDARKFFSQHGDRSYEDTLFYELAVKHADRDQHDQAIDALGYFLKNYPDYYKAPLAQIKLIEAWDKKKNVQEAQNAREELVRKFGRNSPWWQKPRKIDHKELEQIQVRVRDVMLEVAMQLHFPGKERKDSAMVGQAVSKYQRFIEEYGVAGNWPIYRAKIYIADALSWLGRHEEAADAYIWASAENVNDAKKYREPSMAERKLTQPLDAGYNAVVELQMAASAEVIKRNGDKVGAYNAPVTKRYIAAVQSYLSKFPKAADAPDLTYNLFLFQVNGQDWADAISTGNQLLSSYPTYRYAADTRARVAYAYTKSGRFVDAEREYRTVIAALPEGDPSTGPMTSNLAEVIWQLAEKSEKSGKTDSAVFQFRRIARDFPSLSIADSAAFRAAFSFERAKRFKDAAAAYLGFQSIFPQSKLAISAMQAAAENYRNARDTTRAIDVLVNLIFQKYPADSAAFRGISQAASLYDSSGRYVEKAKTLELYNARYPDHVMTPGFLYQAGLAYQKAKQTDTAVFVFRRLAKDFPRSDVADSAAFRAAVALEGAKRYPEASLEYTAFQQNFPNSPLVNRALQAARDCSQLAGAPPDQQAPPKRPTGGRPGSK